MTCGSRRQTAAQARAQRLQVVPCHGVGLGGQSVVELRAVTRTSHIDQRMASREDVPATPVGSEDHVQAALQLDLGRRNQRAVRSGEYRRQLDALDTRLPRRGVASLSVDAHRAKPNRLILARAADSSVYRQCRSNRGLKLVDVQHRRGDTSAWCDVRGAVSAAVAVENETPIEADTPSTAASVTRRLDPGRSGRTRRAATHRHRLRRQTRAQCHHRTYRTHCRA